MQFLYCSVLLLLFLCDAFFYIRVLDSGSFSSLIGWLVLVGGGGGGGTESCISFNGTSSILVIITGRGILFNSLVLLFRFDICHYVWLISWAGSWAGNQSRVF